MVLRTNNIEQLLERGFDQLAAADALEQADNNLVPFCITRYYGRSKLVGSRNSFLRHLQEAALKILQSCGSSSGSLVDAAQLASTEGACQYFSGISFFNLQISFSTMQEQRRNITSWHG